MIANATLGIPFMQNTSGNLRESLNNMTDINNSGLLKSVLVS